MTRLGVDVGARFIDMLAWGDGGVIGHAKEPVGAHLPDDVLAGLRGLDIAPRDLGEIRIASTGFLNCLHDAQGGGDLPRIGLIASAGFEDVAVLGRQDRLSLYDPVTRVATPDHLIDRVEGVSARMDAGGEEISPVDQGQVARIAEGFAARGITAVAVCLLHAHVDGRHERAVAEALSAAAPGLTVSLSHRIDPEPREFERTVSTVLDAWLRITALPALDALQARLRGAGFAGRWVWGDGRGVLTAAPTSLVPLIAGGPAASLRAAALVAEGDSVALDIGSRTTDIALVRGGAPALTEGGVLAGLPIRGGGVDLESLSIGGAQTVAGSRYTLDDALIAAGLMPGQSDCSASEAAQLLGVASQALAEAITRHATRRNTDPTRAGLVLTGGAGALMGPGIAEALGLSQVVLPHLPAIAGAVGLAQAPRRSETITRIDAALDEVTADMLTAKGEGTVHARIAPRPRMPELEVPVDPERLDGLAEDYHAAYRARYGIAPQGPGHVTQLCTRTDDLTGALARDMGEGEVVAPEGWRAIAIPGGTRLERVGG